MTQPEAPKGVLEKAKLILDTTWVLIAMFILVGGSVWQLFARVTALELGRATDKEIVDLKLVRIEDKIDLLLKAAENEKSKR